MCYCGNLNYAKELPRACLSEKMQSQSGLLHSPYYSKVCKVCSWDKRCEGAPPPCFCEAFYIEQCFHSCHPCHLLVLRLFKACGHGCVCELMMMIWFVVAHLLVCFVYLHIYIFM